MTDQPLIIGIQGGPGSFNEEAAHYYLEQQSITNYQIKYLYTTENVLSALDNNQITRGQFAIYNNLGKTVTESTSAMNQFQFKVVAGFSILVNQTLMIHSQTDITQIDTVMAHPQALAQCQNYLKQYYPTIKLISGEGELIDHALVAEKINNGELPKTTGVIGSQSLAKLYDLQVIAEAIQDQKNNWTSFLQVEKIN